MELLHEQVNQAEQLLNQKRNRLQKLAQVFSRTNSVLAGNQVSVRVVEQGVAPAWSNADEVFFNLAEIGDEFNAQQLLAIQGLDFHELAHIRYTPRNGTPLVKWIQEQGQHYWSAFNALEDQRIETLLVGYLPDVAEWLSATVLEFLLKEDEAIETIYPLLRGRKYLPVEIRQLARDNFKKPEIIGDLCYVIDEYRTLLFPQDTERAKELISMFVELLEMLPPINCPVGSGCGEGGECGTPTTIHDPNGHSHRPTQGVPSSSNRPATQEQQKRDKERGVGNANGGEEKDTTRNKKSAPTTNADNNDKSGETTNNSSSQSSYDDYNSDDELEFGAEADTTMYEDEEFEDFDDETPTPYQPSNATPNREAGNGAGKSGSNKQVKDVLTGSLETIIENLSKELDRISRQVNGTPLLEGGATTDLPRSRYKDVPANADLVLIAKRFGTELERLKKEHDPAWLRGVETGKLNVQRYLRNEELDTIFDEWSEGRDDVTAIEAVILLDRSGSMSGTNANNAYQSMWAIKKALEKVEARTTVVTFDSDTELLYSADDKAGTTIRDAGADGGTNPQKAILYAQNVLANTEMPIRILFMITDGAWNTEKGEEAIRKMKQAGVLTCQALIYDGELNTNYLEHNRHSFELLTQVKSAKDLMPLSKELVRLAIGRNLVNH